MNLNLFVVSTNNNGSKSLSFKKKKKKTDRELYKCQIQEILYNNYNKSNEI